MSSYRVLSTRRQGGRRTKLCGFMSEWEDVCVRTRVCASVYDPMGGEGKG